MKLTGLPVYLIAISISLYILTLAVSNVIDISSKLTTKAKYENDMYKICEDFFYNGKNNMGNTHYVGLHSKCFDLLTK